MKTISTTRINNAINSAVSLYAEQQHIDIESAAYVLGEKIHGNTSAWIRDCIRSGDYAALERVWADIQSLTDTALDNDKIAASLKTRVNRESKKDDVLGVALTFDRDGKITEAKKGNKKAKAEDALTIAMREYRKDPTTETALALSRIALSMLEK